MAKHRKRAPVIKTEERRSEKDIEKLHAKIGRLTIERDFLAEAWGKR